MCFRFSGLPLLLPILLLTFTTAALAAPNAPTNLRCAVTGPNAFTLIWDDNSTDESSFDLLFTSSSAGSGTFGLGASAGTGIISTNLSGLTGTATFQIRANGTGSSVSNTVSVAFTSFGTPSDALTKILVDGSVLVMWTDNAYSESGYIVEIATAAGGPYSTWGTTNANFTGISGGLAPLTTYYFRVKGFQGSAASPTASTAPSSVISVTTPVLTPPTGLTATTASESTVNLSWSDNSAVEQGYAVYYKPNSSGTYTFSGYTTANATTYSVTGLVAGMAYDFQVAAAYQSTTVIESARSNTASATTKDGFTSGTAPPIFHNQPFSYQTLVTSGSTRTSWSITGLPTGLTFNSSTGAITGTPTVTGAFNCPMSATFANGWTTSNTLQLRVIRAPTAPVSATTIGAQTLTTGGNTSVSLTDKFSDPDAESAVRIVTNLGTMDFILYNSATPQTVTNFLSYVNAAVNNYNGAVFHRSILGFIVQGGGFKVQSEPNNFSSIPTSASPINEPGISNLRGTVAMAKIGSNPNSATNQFFVNLGNNSSNLDRDSGSPNANGGFTAFARVAGNGMTVADAMAGLPTVNSSVNVDGTPNTSLTDWPLTSASASMDTTKVVSISSAAPVAVLSYAVTGNTNSAVASAAISGTNVQINALSGGQTNVTVTATDLDGNTVAQIFTVTVNQTPAFTNGPPSNTAVVGTAYNFAYTASGFPAPVFSHTGTLPPGLSLSSAGVISGTPTAAGTYSNIVVTASNGVGTAPTQTISITVHQVPVITSNAPPSGVLGTAYSHSYNATGSPAPTYSMTGTLPTGLSLSTAGVISGTPSAVGTFTGTVTATNVAGTSEQAFSITINQVPTFTNGPPPSAGVVGTAYSFAYTASGSPAPTFSHTGTLPPGLSLSSAGVLSGTPTQTGEYTGIVVTASNGIGTAATQNVSITIHQKPAISSNAAPAGILGIGYSHTFTATGSPAPIFSTADPLPTGLTLSPAGVLSGTPSALGTFAGTVTATNVAGTSEQAFNIVINQLPAFTNGPPPASGTVGTAYSFSYTASGSPAPTFALTSGALPAGLSLNPSGAISGTPTNAGGPFTGTITANNGIGTAATQDFSITIAKGTATVTLDGMTLTQTYDGTPKSVTASSSPGGLAIDITYNGSASAPTSHGSHAVLAVVNDSNYSGSASGTLLIQGQSMSNWRTQYFSPEQITAGLADDDADPDGDGWKNLAEYALGMNPTSRNPALLPVRDANGLTLTFTRPKDMPDVTYGAQSTDNFDGWDALTLELVSDGPVQTMRARDPLTSGNPSRRIMQLIFDLPPPIE